VSKNLSGKDWDVVTSIGLSRDVEVLLSVFRELLEEKSEKCIYVFSGSNSVANGATTV